MGFLPLVSKSDYVFLSRVQGLLYPIARVDKWSEYGIASETASL